MEILWNKEKLYIKNSANNYECYKIIKKIR